MVESAFPSGRACCLARVCASISICYPCFLAPPAHVRLIAWQLPVLRGECRRGAHRHLHSVDACTHCASSRCQVRLQPAASTPSTHPRVRLLCACGARELSRATLPSMFSIGQGRSSIFQPPRSRQGPSGPHWGWRPRTWGELAPQVSGMCCPLPEH